MEKYEQELLKRFGKNRPFTVPEGYFDHFSEQLMNSLPTSNSTKCASTRHSKMFVRLLRYTAAACFVAVFSILGINSFLTTKNTVEATVAEPHYSGDKLFDQIADYTMMDNDDYYATLSDY